jgi:hypothetical protein
MTYKKFGVIKVNVFSESVNNAYLGGNYFDKVSKLVTILNNFLSSKTKVYIPLSNSFNNWCIGEPDIINYVGSLYKSYNDFYDSFDEDVNVSIIYSEIYLPEEVVKQKTIKEFSSNNSDDYKILSLLKNVYIADEPGVHKIDLDISIERLVNNGKVDKNLHKNVVDQFDLGEHNYYKQFIKKTNFQPPVHLENYLKVEKGTFSREWKFPFNLDADNMYSLHYFYSILDDFYEYADYCYDILYNEVIELNPDLQKLLKYGSKRTFKFDIVNGCASGFKIRDMDYFLKYENYQHRPKDITNRQQILDTKVDKFVIQFVCSPETLDKLEKILDERNSNN